MDGENVMNLFQSLVLQTDAYKQTVNSHRVTFRDPSQSQQGFQSNLNSDDDVNRATTCQFSSASYPYESGEPACIATVSLTINKRRANNEQPLLFNGPND